MGLDGDPPRYIKLDVTWEDIQAANSEAHYETTRDPIARAACRALDVPLGTVTVGITDVSVCEGDGAGEGEQDRVIARYRMEEAGCKWLWMYDLNRGQAQPIKFGAGLRYIPLQQEQQQEPQQEQAPAGQPAGDGAHEQQGSASYDIYDEPADPGDGPGPEPAAGPDPDYGGLWREPGDEPDPEPGDWGTPEPHAVIDL